MSYIGNTNTTQGFIPAVDYFNGNGSTTAFTLSRPVASVAQVQAVIENVPQNPGSAFTVSGSTITFTSAPPSGTSNIYVYYTSPITQVIQPGQGTVGTAQLAGGTVSTTADITANGLTVGKGAGSVSTNTAVGANALAANTTGVTNNAFGQDAMSANTTGNNNHAFGQGALRANTTGGQNVAIGRLALAASNADSNTAVGHNALTSDTSGANNTAIGSSALAFNTTASNNTAVGYQAAYGNTTGLNTTIGSQALYSGSTASRNTVVGFQAGYSTTGSYNTFIGDGSGYSVTSGSKNTIIGNYSGNQGGLNITTASNYIVLSDGDGNPRAYCDNDYTTVINAPSGKTYSQFDWRIGNVAKASIWWNDSTTRLQTYTTVHGPYLTQGGTSWTNSSDERLKNITGEIQDGLNKVCSLRAAEYTWKSDETAKPQVGLIAQDVLAVLPQAVDVPIEGAVEKDGGEAMLGVNYDHVIPLLVAAIKELKADLDATKAELAALKGSQ